MIILLCSGAESVELFRGTRGTTASSKSSPVSAMKMSSLGGGGGKEDETPLQWFMGDEQFVYLTFSKIHS